MSRFVLCVVVLSACNGLPRTGPDGGAAPLYVAGPDTTAGIFADAHMTGANRQTEATVELPAGQFTQITLHWTLKCPAHGCDPWDRIAELHVVKPGTDGGEETFEIARLITPYGVGATWDFDVTSLAPVLTGSQKFRLFIDTWVDGWMNDISLEYKGGIGDSIPVEVTNLWRNGGAVYGDPARPFSDQFPARSLTRAAGETLSARVIVTGHGQGNLNNCAEFCQKTHHLHVGATALDVAPWRSDCGQNPVSNQQGSWRYPRAGWCPGSEVRPIVFDVTESVAVGGTTAASLELEPYENTCRPAAAAGMTCPSCAIGSSCDYNSNGHTEPFYDTTVQIIRFRTK